MSFTVFSVAIILIFATTAAIEISRGIRRGVFKSLISLGTDVVSIVFSASLSPIISEIIVKLLYGITVRRLSIYNYYVGQYESLDLLAESLVCIAVSILIFVILFFILRLLIGGFIALCLKRVLKPRASDPGYCGEKTSFFSANSKALGGVVGAVCAILVTMVATCPAMGILDISGSAISAAEEINENIWEQMWIDEESMDRLEEYSKDIPGNIFYRLGGEYMFRAAASTELYGKQVYLMDEIDTVISAAKDFNYVFTVILDPEKSNSRYIEHIHCLCAHIEDLNICHGALAEFISIEAGLWLNDEGYMLMQKPRINEVVEPVFDSVLRICADSGHKNIRENTVTLLRTYAIILESGITKVDAGDLDAILACVDQSDIINKLQAELSSNPGMSDIRISSLALSVLARQIHDGKVDEEAYSLLVNNLADAVSTVQNKGYGSIEEQVTVLTDRVTQYISDYGITLSEGIAEYTAEELLTILQSNAEELPTDQLRELLAQYADQHMEGD